ncbi:MAG: preprotein translocase subunit YajC [Acidobacteriia bacterium]|nr:preprotein translocase subunit YajC [Terriglobia bacterium]
MTVPDFISPVVGYRVWQWDATGLRSLNGEKWVAHQPLSAVCRADVRGSIAGLSKATHNPAELPSFSCTCGVYAARTMDHLRQCGYRKLSVHGEVFLWGTVVEHERGWRAQFAYPKTLFLAADAIPFSLSEINSRLTTLAEFGTDIFLLHDSERLVLWKHGSGFDAAGLDYLINRRKEHYVRRQQERTLKPGDRVAVLGHGIAVVEQIDGKEVHVALGNRHVLRIARKEIVVNEQNNRWECEANKARGYQACE